MTCNWRFKTTLKGREYEFLTCTDSAAVTRDLALPTGMSLLRMAAASALPPGQNIEGVLHQDPQRVQCLLAAAAIQHHISLRHHICPACTPQLIPSFNTAGCTSNALGGGDQAFLLQVWERVVS